MTRKVRTSLHPRIVLIMVLAVSGLAQRSMAQATISVNTTQQGITNGQCSLQEAIYSAEFGANIALSQTDPDTTYITGCTPGTGNGDTIVLQSGATYEFKSFWDGDAHNTERCCSPAVPNGNFRRGGSNHASRKTHSHWSGVL